MKRTMRLLTRASLTAPQLDTLLQLTKIESKPKIKALHSHLVDGNSKTAAAFINNIPKQHLSTTVKELEKKVKIIEKYIELQNNRN